ncbi:MAG: Fic family protein [Lachnospiraceae bacterium]|nr:Fic family protein [Lachnospiraceae bacterium]
MKYLSVAEMAKKWNISERSVRNYCAGGRIPGAFLTGKTWNIPETAVKPVRTNAHREEPKTLLAVLKNEKESGTKGGIYHRIQIDLTYNSNHMEGSRLTHDQTRYIYETNTICTDSEGMNVDDILETANHFRCIDLIIDQAHLQVSEKLIKQLHLMLKTGTSDSRKEWFVVGDYKRLPNEVGGKETAAPEEVSAKMKRLLAEYNTSKVRSFDEILDFHYRFESIHPFQDGNGRVGRLIMFKECLRNNIVPFIIEDDLKLFYYRGLASWRTERGFLRDTCLTAQDRFKRYLDYFRIGYDSEND